MWIQGWPPIERSLPLSVRQKPSKKRPFKRLPVPNSTLTCRPTPESILRWGHRCLSFCPCSRLYPRRLCPVGRELGERVGNELGIPVFFYEAAAAAPHRKRLPDLRKKGVRSPRRGSLIQSGGLMWGPQNGLIRLQNQVEPSLGYVHFDCVEHQS